MNFFENFGRVNTTSISKIAVKSHKFCVKNLLDTRLRLLPVFSVNKGSRGGGGEGCQRFYYVTEGGVYCQRYGPLQGGRKESQIFANNSVT